MFKISNAEFNKLIACADRYITYDRRYTQKEDATQPFAFSAFDDDRCLAIFIGRSSAGVYISITRNGTSVRRYLVSYSDVNGFKKWLKVIG